MHVYFFKFAPDEGIGPLLPLYLPRDLWREVAREQRRDYRTEGNYTNRVYKFLFSSFKVRVRVSAIRYTVYEFLIPFVEHTLFIASGVLFFDIIV